MSIIRFVGGPYSGRSIQFHEPDVQEQLDERAKRQRLWPAGRYLLRATTQAYGFYPVADWVPRDDRYGFSDWS